MRTGDASQRGYSYLAVLFLVALTAAGLAALGQAWSTAAQREKERELAFRGGEIARAIGSYLRASPGGQALQYPASLADLVDDRRGIKPRHHLRRLYVDPFTQLPDWELLPQAVGASNFGAVRSRSEQPLLREQRSDGLALKRASDWVFSAADYPSGAPAASGPGTNSLPASAPPR